MGFAGQSTGLAAQVHTLRNSVDDDPAREAKEVLRNQIAGCTLVLVRLPSHVSSGYEHLTLQLLSFRNSSHYASPSPTVSVLKTR